MIPCSKLADDQEGYPILSLEESLAMFYNFSFAVCIRMEKRHVWAENEFGFIECHPDPKDVNEADALAILVMKALHKKMIPVQLVNDYLLEQSRKWESGSDNSIHRYETNGK